MKTILPLGILLCCTACHTQEKHAETDLMGDWYEVMPVNSQIIQGIRLEEGGKASSIGMKTLQYDKWNLLPEDRLVLSGRSVGNGQTIQFEDTMDIVKHTVDTLVLGKHGTYQRVYCRDSVKQSGDVLDSLVRRTDAGQLVTETYAGTLPAASCPGIVYRISISHYEHSGDGVFQASMKYLEAEDGKDRMYYFQGRQFTLRGHADDPDAVVIQLVSFDGKEMLNFEKMGTKLVMLDRQMHRIQSDLDYSLELQ